MIENTIENIVIILQYGITIWKTRINGTRSRLIPIALYKV